MSGFVGKNSIRRSSKVGHSKRWCATVSSGHGHRGHLESVTTPILLRCEFRGACCDLRRNMVTCSSLLREFMLCFGFGVVIWLKYGLKMGRNVLPTFTFCL